MASEGLFVFAGSKDFKFGDDTYSTKWLEERLTDAWKTKVEILTIVKDISPEDIGMNDPSLKCCLLKLKGVDITGRKYSDRQTAVSVTDVQNIEMTNVECELKLKPEYIEVIGNFADVLVELSNTVGIEILENQKGEHFISGKWFQVAVAKRQILSLYINQYSKKEIECCDEISKDGKGLTAMESLVEGNPHTYVKDTTKWSISYTIQNRCLGLSAMTIGYYKKQILSNAQVTFIEVEGNEGIVNVEFLATTRARCQEGVNAFHDGIKKLQERYGTYTLTTKAPVSYNKMLNDILQTKFGPTLTISIGNGKKIIYTMPLAKLDQLKQYAESYMETVVPSAKCDLRQAIVQKVEVSRTSLLKPTTNIQSKKTSDGIPPKDEEKQTEKSVKKEEIKNEKQLQEMEKQQAKQDKSKMMKCIAKYVSSPNHIKYMKLVHEDAIKSSAGSQIKVKFLEDDGEIRIEGSSEESVSDLLAKLKELHLKDSLVTKEIPYGQIENEMVDDGCSRILILHSQDSSKTELTGPKSVVEKIESMMAGTGSAGAQRQPLSRTSSYDTAQTSDVNFQPSSSESNDLRTSVKTSGRSRVRQLVQAGSPQANGDTTGTISRILAGHDARVYTHYKSRVNVEVGVCDLTTLSVDAIVNAANGQLKHEGGIAKAIAMKAGSELNVECQAIVRNKELNVGQTCTTKGYRLPCKYIIHAVGPAYHKYSLKDACLKALKETFQKCLEDADVGSYATIALPAISSGVYGVPKEKVAAMACEAATEFLDKQNGTSLKTICFTDISPDMVSLFNQEFLRQAQSGSYKKLSTDGSSV